MIICLFFLTAGDKGKKVNYQKKKSMRNDLLTAWHGPSAVLALHGVYYYYFFFLSVSRPNFSWPDFK